MPSVLNRQHLLYYHSEGYLKEANGTLHIKRLIRFISCDRPFRQRQSKLGDSAIWMLLHALGFHVICLRWYMTDVRAGDDCSNCIVISYPPLFAKRERRQQQEAQRRIPDKI
jgi:hypothetical protein